MALWSSRRPLNRSVPSPLKSSSQVKPSIPNINECCESVLAAAVIAKLVAQKGDRFTRISNGDINNMLHLLRKDAITHSKKLVTFKMKLSADRRICMQLHSAGVDALSDYSTSQGQARLAPLISKACVFVNSTGFEAKVKDLVGEIEIRVAGSIHQFSNVKVSLKGNAIQID
jgi:hypothetical protein